MTLAEGVLRTSSHVSCAHVVVLTLIFHVGRFGEKYPVHSRE